MGVAGIAIAGGTGCKLVCNTTADCGTCDDVDEDKWHFCYPKTKTCVSSRVGDYDWDNNSGNTATIVIWFLLAALLLLSFGICIGLGIRLKSQNVVYPVVTPSNSTITLSNSVVRMPDFTETENRLSAVINVQFMRIHENMKRRDHDFFRHLANWIVARTTETEKT